MTRVLANRLANRNINVNAIAPGPFQSNMMAHTLEEHGDEIKSSVPRGRIGMPEDMAGVTLFLSSKRSANIQLLRGIIFNKLWSLTSLISYME